MDILSANQDYIYKKMIEFAVDGIILINPAGIILSINQAALRLFETSESETLGKNVSILMPEPYSSLHDEFVQKYMETGEKKIIGKGREVFAKTKTGKIIPVLLSISEIITDKGKLFCGMLKDITERKRSEQEIAHLSNKIIAIQEEERDRISKEIHDDLGTSLSLLKLMLQSSFSLADNRQKNHEIFQEKFNESIQYLNSIADTAREISHNLSPVAYRNLGLIYAIEKLAQRAFSSPNYDVHLEIEPLNGFFTDNWNINLYRVFQEAFTHIIKHAKAQKIEITATRSLNSAQKEKLKIKIQDDGSGFHFENRGGKDKKGMGLSIMKKRIADIGGSIKIRSIVDADNKQQGTVIEIEI